ncbi:nuclear transport factor 2 family protein [Leucobacter sp. M11]|uniref:nuclear transport factor 2 family protein n=1 Tax=Leucobacter sp. M11 TaxID=2993565 RepID=UPI002D7E7A87|nr:nuclear transport factor 2 family protein [Leucobacter sp. M11]MEB4613622.1 nuclear transport factor 2 family protein [Leucobacter sp. M11]
MTNQTPNPSPSVTAATTPEGTPGAEQNAPTRATPEPAPPSEHPSEHAVAEQLRELERGRLRALVAGDLATARGLHAEAFQVITPIGLALSREQYLGAIESGGLRYELWEPEDIRVRVHGETATLRYRARLRVVFGGHRVETCAYWHTDTYERGASGWQAVWSQATQILPPAGTGYPASADGAASAR